MVRRYGRQAGITMIELLIVLAIIGIIGGIGVISGSEVARRKAAEGAISTFQQSVWQGATMAASRGATVELVREGRELRLRTGDDSARTLRSFELPAGVEIPVGNPILRFLPPGKIDTSSLNGLPENLVITTSEGRYRLSISVIGEVRAERLGDS